jgi:hypothetical protein
VARDRDAAAILAALSFVLAVVGFSVRLVPIGLAAALGVVVTERNNRLRLQFTPRERMWIYGRLYWPVALQLIGVLAFNLFGSGKVPPRTELAGSAVTALLLVVPTALASCGAAAALRGLARRRAQLGEH